MSNGAISDRADLGDLLLDSSRDPRPLLFGPGRFGIIWSAKSACTTLLLWYLWHCNLLQAARFYGAWPHNFRNHVLYTSQTYRAWASEVDPSSWSWLRIVRDPFKRAISSYRHALKIGNEDAEMARVLRRSVDCKNGFSFELFLDYLLRIDIATCNLHHRAQIHPIETIVTPNQVINVDKDDLMGQLHGIDATLEAPKESAEVLLRAIAEIASSHHTSTSMSDRDQAARVFTTGDAWQEWPAQSDFLNDSTRSKIAVIYATDLAHYADHW